MFNTKHNYLNNCYLQNEQNALLKSNIYHDLLLVNIKRLSLPRF